MPPRYNNGYDSNIEDLNADSILEDSDPAPRKKKKVKRYSERTRVEDDFDVNTVPQPQNRPKYVEPEVDDEPDTFADNEPEETPRGARIRKKKEDNTPASRRRAKQRKDDGEEEDRGFVTGLKQFFCDGRFRIFSGILLMLLSAATLFITISHIKNGVADQSQVLSSTVDALSQQPGAVKNVGGAFGAWLSHVLFTDSLGVGALVFAVYLFVISLKLLHLLRCSFWSVTFKCLLIAITLSMVLGLVTYGQPSEIYWGGEHGHLVNQYLISHAGWLSAVIVSALLVAAVVCIYINDIITLWRKGRRRLQAMKEHRNQMLDRQRRADDLADSVVDEKDDDGDVDDDTDTDIPAEDITFDTPETYTDLNGNTLPAQRSGAGHDDGPLDIDDTFLDIDTPDTPDIPDRPDTPAPGADGEPGFEVKAGEIEVASSTTNKVHIDSDELDPRAELSRYRFPDIEILSDSASYGQIDEAEQQANKERIINTLRSYEIPISRIEATVGPTVTLYEIVPAEGVRIARIKNLEDDIAMSLSALGIRIIAPIPGKGTIGIEVPNKNPQTVSMRQVLSSKAFQTTTATLPLAMGATISNEIFIEDLAKMPHLLVAGGSGTGKSVGLNVIITSLIYKKHPAELKFVLIDPKMVEFSLYEKLERHYLAKLPDEEKAIITDPSKALLTLNSLCVEMDQRYALLSKAMVRTVEDYNKKFRRRVLNPEKGHRYMPYIVVIVDEFADLIMTAGKEVYISIARLAQKARAVGMHMIIATQRPSTDVITGVIKANFLGRIAFKVSNMVDSKTILDRTGANRLIGRGDMLFSLNGKFERVQCAFVSTEDVEAMTDAIDSQVGYPNAYFLPEYVPEGGGVTAGPGSDRDPLFDESARFIITQSSASTSSLQRRYSIGYNRASRIMEQLEAAGIVGPASGAKPRSILVDSITLDRILENA